MEDDDAIAFPGPAPATGSVAKRLRRPAGSFDLLELVVGEECDEAAVRRPEGRTVSAIGVSQRLGGLRVQRAHPEPALAGFGRGKSQAAAVRRDGEGFEYGLIRRQYRSLRAALLGRRLAEV